MTNKHDEKTLLCAHCENSCADEVILSNHMEESHKNMNLEDEEDEETNATDKAPHSISNGSHKIDEFLKCQTCDRTFTNKTRLKKHMQVHEEHPYKCEECGRTFTSVHGRAIHIAKAHQVGNICDMCGFSSKSSAAFRIHIEEDHDKKKGLMPNIKRNLSGITRSI